MKNLNIFLFFDELIKLLTIFFEIFLSTTNKHLLKLIELFFIIYENFETKFGPITIG
jgi:hypothetical protein